MLAQAVDPSGDDGDLNANHADPFPTDPTKDADYVGGAITCDVLMICNLVDAAAFTGTVITLATDEGIFDGYGHKIVAPTAGMVMPQRKETRR